MMLAVSISLHLEGTTEEQPTQQGMDFLARSGRTLSPITIRTPMWEITTTAGILMGIPMVCGASPLTQIREHNTVQSPFALL